MKQQICILGSTGSIGTQALDVIEQHSDLYEVYCLTANHRVKELAAQAHKFHPAAVVIADETLYEELQDLLRDELDIKVYAGAQALCDIVEADPIDMVLASMVGFSGLEPTIHAIKARKKICLANKETLVVAGELICQLAQQYHAPILPVDSEHSAIFQSLVGEGNNEIEKILLTASGGPFRKFTLEQMADVKAADALKHPNWNMGAKITIDSATLMNKGLELIEAVWLFGLPPEKIQIVVQRQSIVHSAVQYSDNSIIAQLGVPDMRIPIQYALTYPARVPGVVPELDFTTLKLLTFDVADEETFRCLAACKKAIKKGGLGPCAANGANEEAVKLFLEDKIGFLDIGRLVEAVVDSDSFGGDYTLADVYECDKMARAFVRSHL